MRELIAGLGTPFYFEDRGRKRRRQTSRGRWSFTPERIFYLAQVFIDYLIAVELSDAPVARSQASSRLPFKQLRQRPVRSFGGVSLPTRLTNASYFQQK